jgi:sulfite exporter TauE/SafE/copper chaperone CopZ
MNIKNQKCSYFVNGMHCAGCEILIEKKLLKQSQIKSVQASTANNNVEIEYSGGKPSLSELNKLFATDGYSFSEDASTNSLISTAIIVLSLVIIYLLYVVFEKLGITSWVNVNTDSALPTFFFFGIIAGLSSCAALVGGIVLSMSKQWYELYSANDTFTQKLQPHLMFNLGRLISFALLGGVLGAIGSVFQMSSIFSAILTISVSLLMVLMGLQMLGIKALHRFQLTVPKSFSKFIADESNFAGKYMPFLMGALTFFLPCGFTITAQGLAMASGDPIKGSLIMTFFALGTSPMLLIIGMSSTKLYEKTHLAANFLKLVGIVVVIFGLSTFNSQLTVLGLSNLSDIWLWLKSIT